VTGGAREKALGAAAVAAVTGLLLGSIYVLKPESFAFSGFLFQDQGVNLYAAERLLAGDALYRDLAWQYGPVPAYAYALFSWVFGNSVETYFLWLALGSTATMVLAYVVMARFASVATSVVVTLFVVLPWALVPGSPFAGYTSNAYIPLEKICLLVAMLLWTPPTRRSLGRAAAMGAVLGVWQAVKFGGAVFMVPAILLADGIYLVATRRATDVAVLRALALRTAVMGGVLLAVEAVRVGVLYATLPAEVAFDAAWPAYLVQAYDTLPDFMYMRNSWKYFLERAQTGAIPILLALAGLAWSIPRARRSDEGHEDLAGCLTLSLGLFFYAFASLRYFAHVPLFLQYFWCALLGGALFLDRLKLPVRAIIALLLTPGLFYVARNIYWTPRAEEVESYRTPSGDVLYLHPADARRVEALYEAIPEGESGKLPVLFAARDLTGSGFVTLFGLRAPLRTHWFIPGFVRPYDEEELREFMRGPHALVLLCRNAPCEGPCGQLRDALPEDLCAEIDRLAAEDEVVEVEVGLRVFARSAR
jgi:hypothetical protein